MAIVVTKPIVNNSQTKLLITGSGTTFTDSSAGGGGKTITRVADTTWSTTVKSPAVKAVYFDGNQDYISIADSNDWNYGTGDFTIDFWFYNTRGLGGYNVIYEQIAGGEYNQIFTGTDNKMVFYSNGVMTTLNSTTVFSASWNHISWCRNGTDCRVYVNNVSETYVTSSASFSDFAAALTISKPSATDAILGYIKNFRITKGEALANGGYSTNPLNGTPTIDANTVFLLGHGATDTTFKDLATNKTITTNGGTIARYTDASWSKPTIYFDGTGDYLTVPDSSDFNFGVGNVTIHGWIYLTAITAGNDVVYSHGTDNSNFFIFYHNSDHGWRCFWKGKGDTFITETSSPMTLNTLHHIALVKNGTSWLIFEDGKQVASATNVNAYQDFTGTPYIGYVSNADFGTISIDASYMSQITIVKGQALWTSNFEPPLRHLA